ncbi:hypothetical protein O1611_g1507 [Lasiodiplodia mahajangana]|uniref:Uncharacterized protein n=1 Tax=Lasiodiplodia mahajangana TaxID=1108764 RepID=A0ACC2JXR6_9PEZI|nr:hypothetical protein O1611_g1507 [Lasiodiplodia mahajangana]
MDGSRNFTTKVPYIARDPLYKEEKLYSCDFNLGDSVIRNNHRYDWASVNVTAITDPKAFDLDTHGFCVLNAKTFVSPEKAIAEKPTIEDAYGKEVETLLHHHFPQYTRFEVMNIIVRKRDERYPSPEDFSVVSHEQPARVPHCDFSLSGLPLQTEASFPDQWENLKDKDFDVLNLWRPLNSPNDDWPLAIADFTSIHEGDVILNDDLHRDRAVENSLLHFNPGHRWYYLPSQTIEDILVFRTVDSTGKRPYAFHCAVNSPFSKPGELRSSIEARVYAIR